MLSSSNVNGISAAAAAAVESTNDDGSLARTRDGHEGNTGTLWVDCHTVPARGHEDFVSVTHGLNM